MYPTELYLRFTMYPTELQLLLPRVVYIYIYSLFTWNLLCMLSCFSSRVTVTVKCFERLLSGGKGTQWILFIIVTVNVWNPSQIQSLKNKNKNPEHSKQPTSVTVKGAVVQHSYLFAAVSVHNSLQGNFTTTLTQKGNQGNQLVFTENAFRRVGVFSHPPRH